MVFQGQGSTERQPHFDIYPRARYIPAPISYLTAPRLSKVLGELLNLFELQSV